MNKLISIIFLAIFLNGCSVQRSVIKDVVPQFETLEPVGYSPSAFSKSDEQDAPERMNEIFKQTDVETASSALIISPEAFADKDTTKTKPVVEPLGIAGTALSVVGLGAAVAGVFVNPVLLLLAAGLFAGACILCAMSLSKIKKEPKKYTGDKITNIGFIITGIVGVAATFYLIYLLFTF